MYFHTPYSYLNYLTPNAFSRPGRNRKFTRGIVWHWVANANTDERMNRNYFEGLKDQSGVGTLIYASAVSIIGFKRIICNMADSEEAFHVGANNYTEVGKRLMEGCRNPNQSLMGVELCHPDWTGKPDDLTYKLAVSWGAEKATAWGLNPLTDFYLHGEVVLDKDPATGKLSPRGCHRYWIDNPQAWAKFKKDVVDYQNSLRPKTVADQEMWKHDAVMGMHERELITSVDWAKRFNEPSPLWFDAVTNNRLYDKMQDQIDELHKQINELKAAK